MTGISILLRIFREPTAGESRRCALGERHPTSSLPEMAGRLRAVIAIEWAFLAKANQGGTANAPFRP